MKRKNISTAAMEFSAAPERVAPPIVSPRVKNKSECFNRASILFSPFSQSYSIMIIGPDRVCFVSASFKLELSGIIRFDHDCFVNERLDLNFGKK